MLKRDEMLNPQIPDNCSVKIIGLGGVGGIVARYSMMFLASLGKSVRCVLIDGDNFEVKNSNRMFFSGFGNKAEVTKDDLIERFRDSNMSIITIPEYVTQENIDRLIHEDDIVIMCVDNHATRKVINTHCGKLKNVCLLSGGNDGVGKNNAGEVTRGTYGNVQIYIRRNGKDASPSLTKYHPEIDKPADKLPTELSCTDLVESTPQILFANLATASAICNALMLYLSNRMHYSELCFEIADGLMRPMGLPAPKLD